MLVGLWEADLAIKSNAMEEQPALAAWLGERAGRAVEVRVPQRGAPRELHDLALKNAEGTLERRHRPVSRSASKFSP